MRRFIRFALLAATLGLLATTTPAAPRVDTDPYKEYPCTPESGAWMICVHEFRGPDAAELARQMVLQIRQRDNLPAYVFDFGEAHKKKLEEEWSNLGKLNPDGTPRKVHVSIPDERVVLIGGYRDFDAASAALKTVKKLPPPELSLPGKFPFDQVTIQEPRADGRVHYETKQVNPFPTSFVAPNPTIQRQQETKKTDPLLMKLNESEEYSLLKNPRPWTLAVKEYVGDTLFLSRNADSSPSMLDKLFNPNKAADSLYRAGQQAHEMARLLRTQVSDKNPFFGFEAYVLHTRHSSIVTVGSFSGPDDPEMRTMAERVLKLNEMQKMNEIAVKSKLQANAPKVASVEFFAAPMEIPRP
jgi:hypothetical protein